MDTHIKSAERKLEEALALLRDGRAGASYDWLEAAQHYVEVCRRSVERARSQNAAIRDADAGSVPKRPGSQYGGHRPN